jgi:ABC-type spermidine/putrescine transport system permease subunit II
MVKSGMISATFLAFVISTQEFIIALFLYSPKTITLPVALYTAIREELNPGGEFLTHSHTFDNMRAISKSDLFDRQSRSSWMDKTAGRDLTERAYERALDNQSALACSI